MKLCLQRVPDLVMASLVRIFPKVASFCHQVSRQSAFSRPQCHVFSTFVLEFWNYGVLELANTTYIRKLIQTVRLHWLPANKNMCSCCQMYVAPAELCCAASGFNSSAATPSMPTTQQPRSAQSYDKHGCVCIEVYSELQEPGSVLSAGFGSSGDQCSSAQCSLLWAKHASAQ